MEQKIIQLQTEPHLSLVKVALTSPETPSCRDTYLTLSELVDKAYPFIDEKVEECAVALLI